MEETKARNMNLKRVVIEWVHEVDFLLRIPIEVIETKTSYAHKYACFSLMGQSIQE